MQQIIESRRIDCLYHFTQAKNLKGILTYGLLPKDNLDSLGIPYCHNDDYRFDNCTDAVCCSLEFPNYKMFYSLRMNYPDIDWVVLKLDARILYELKCAFCWTNAGDSSMYSVPIEQRMGKQAFANLFTNRPGYPPRETLGIPDYYPTNPQAEILVFDTIPIDYIQYIYFQDSATYDKYFDIIPPIFDATWQSDIFCPRKDWEFWKTR